VKTYGRSIVLCVFAALREYPLLPAGTPVQNKKEENLMTHLFPNSKFLRYVLALDAMTCIATGLLMSVGGAALSNLTGLPAGLLFYAGVGLFPFAAVLLYLATRTQISAAPVWTVVILNALWTIDSFLLLWSGWVETSTFGTAFVVFQAVGVAAFAVLEYVGVRRAEIATARTQES
jgi:hypothetical protein